MLPCHAYLNRHSKRSVCDIAMPTCTDTQGLAYVTLPCLPAQTLNDECMWPCHAYLHRHSKKSVCDLAMPTCTDTQRGVYVTLPCLPAHTQRLAYVTSPYLPVQALKEECMWPCHAYLHIHSKMRAYVTLPCLPAQTLKDASVGDLAILEASDDLLGRVW